jgi:hypothetical protein
VINSCFVSTETLSIYGVGDNYMQRACHSTDIGSPNHWNDIGMVNMGS